ncbi:bactofilin family protein [Haliangium ochraceum]|nr:polymer-forming cytoskeletal protein [Haliangium ochraceum]
MRIHGRVTVDGDVVIAGTFAGALTVTGRFTLAPGASCQASVHAREAEVHGTFTGALSCANSIEVAAAAVVTGDLIAPVVQVAEGAEISGEIVRGDVAVDAVEPAPAMAAETRLVAIPSVRRARSGRSAVRVQGPAPRRPQPPPAAGEAPRRARAYRIEQREIPAPPRPRGVFAVRRNRPAQAGAPGAPS